MKIYILRHEDRTMDLTFFSPLTKDGLENSIDLIKDLEKADIDTVYSSPYIRTLQTVYPYCKKYNIKPNLDYSLTELYMRENLPEKSYKITLPEYMAESFNYDNDYNSLITPNDIEFPEDKKSFSKRIKSFLKKLIVENFNTSNNILLVTHQGVVDIIYEIISKRLFKNHRSSDINDYSKYPKGGLTKIFDNNKWDFNKINWK